jgi:nucleoid DNA-binding protein
MWTTTKKLLVASIVENTGVRPGKAKQALASVLESIKLALASGRHIALGKLGKLKVVRRKPTRRINGNLKNRVPTIENIYEKHPKTVRLVGGKDLSPNPLPTIIHKPEPAVKILAKRSFLIALPSWRRRIQ